jgi:zinc protease
MTMRRYLAALALLLPLALSLTPLAAGAQTPAPVSRTRLPNGLTVIVRENRSAPVVAVSLMTKMGTRYETRGTAGISNLLQIMLVRGTTTRNGTEIIEAAEEMGGSLESYGDVDYSEIAATALSRNWADMLALVADVALNPTLPEGTTQAVQEFLLKQIRNRAEKPADAGSDFLGRRLFGTHPYAWNPMGYRDSIERMTRDALVAHYLKFYVPGNMVLAVSGRVKAAEVQAEAQKLFGGLRPGADPGLARASAPALEGTRDVLEVPGAQAQIFMAGFAPALTEPEFAAVKVLATVLGGGMAGRFFSELRDKQGLAYTTGMVSPPRVERGQLVAQIGTAPENAEKSEAALRSELERIRREPPSDEEVRIAKAYLLGNLAMDRRTNARQAWYMAAYELAGVGPDFPERYTAQVRAVTAADVQRAAQRYLATVRTVVVRPPAR